jgi:hypothetical protein
MTFFTLESFEFGVTSLSGNDAEEVVGVLMKLWMVRRGKGMNQEE